MVDPVLNFLNAVFLIFERLPGPYFSLFLMSAVFSGILIVFKFVRGL